MMKLSARLVLSGFLLVAASSAFASTGNDGSSNSGGSSDSDLPTYLLNLGGYLGYDLQTSPTGNNMGRGSSTATISQNFLNLPALQVMGNYLFNSFLGALPVNTATQVTGRFVPANSQTYSSINAFANYTFTSPPYASPSPEQVSVSPLVDQPPYQTDPVSQSLVNILGTPDSSYCLNNEGTAVTKCSYASGTLNASQVMINAIGTIPGTQNYFTYNGIQPLLSQLNSNSLITPLLYTTTTSSTSSTSSGNNSNQQNQGLAAPTQAQQAANFIRYASGLVAPLRLPNRNEYDALYIKAQNTSGSYSQLEQQHAQATLAHYLTDVRIYAAQASVGISNLYYILSRRLPQSQSTDNSGQATSQALSEFTMASWRLYNPDQTPNTQWLAQINQASSATVQKEIAGLLAEINYQMYLSRQQQERILLTNTMMLLQTARSSQNTPSLTLTAQDQGTASQSETVQ